MTSSDYDVVIVGAGAIGSCTAWNLGSDHDVLVLEKGQFTDNASANAAAFVSDWWRFLGGERVPGAIDIQRDFFAELEGTGRFEFHEHPYVGLVGDRGTLSRSDDVVARSRERAEDVDGVAYLAADDLEERWPGLLNLDGIEGGVVDERAGVVDAVEYLAAVKGRAERDGVEFRTETEVTDLVTDDGAVVGVEVSGDRVYADAVVVAAGSRTSDLVSEFAELPVRTFVILAVPFRHPEESNLPDCPPIVADDELLVGPDAHGNLTIGVEFWIEGPGSVPDEYPTGTVERSAKHVPRLLQGFDDVRLLNDRANECPEGITVTPDQLPVVDTLKEGLVVADGSRGGVSMAPVVAEAVRSRLTGSELPFSLDRFAVDRFDPESPDVDVPFVTDASST